MTLDESAIKKRVLLRLLSSAWTLAPLVTGLSLLLAVWALSIKSGLAVFVGIASVLGAAGIFFTRLALGSGEISKEVVAELQKEAEVERERALDDLEQRLRALTSDPRDEQCLRDLRVLAKAFGKDQGWSALASVQSNAYIVAGIEELFDRCVQSLQKTLALWETARKMSSAAARKPFLEQREKILRDVGASIQHLSEILTGIQNLEDGQGAQDSELARIREELDRSLEVARTVEQRMHSLDLELDGLKRSE